MSLLRRPAVWLVFAAVLAAGWAAVGSSPSPAGADFVKDGAVCWVSGPLDGADYDDQGSGQGKQGYGGDSEFVLDIQDFWRTVSLSDDTLIPWDDESGGLSGDAKSWGYFSSFPQAIDFTFAMYGDELNFFPPDTRGHDLKRLVFPDYGKQGERAGPFGDGRARVPWDTQRGYAARRAVGADEGRRVQSFEALWVDPFHPDGGIGVDWQRFATDLLGGQADIAASTHAQVESGDRLIVSTGVTPVMTMGGTRSVNCTAARCDFSDTVRSGVAQAAVSQTATDASRNEVTGQPVTSGERQVTAGGGTQTSTVRAVRTDRSGYQSESGSYGALFQEDTEADKLYVNILLDPEDRADYEYKVVERGDVSKFYIRNMGIGESLWTYDDFGGYPPVGLHTAYRPAGSGASTGTTIGGAIDRRWGIPYDSFDDHRGYRQPAIGRTVLDFDSLDQWDPEGCVFNLINPTCTYQISSYGFGQRSEGNLSTATGIAHYTEHDWDRIRWPVNVEDLNWYLYSLPGSSGESGGNMLSFWLSDAGGNWVMGSGYGQSAHGSTWSEFPQLPNCWWLDQDDSDDAALPVLPTAGGMECRDNTTPLRSGLNDGDVFAVSNPNRDELRKGELSGVFYPFGLTSGGPYTSGTLWSFKQRQDQIVGDYPPAEIRARSLQTYMPVLVRAGVASPYDAGNAPPRMMNRFTFVIDELSEVGESSLSAAGVDALRRYGAPISDGWRRHYFENWPNLELDPNQPHFMVVTFYESLKNGGGDRHFSLEDSSRTLNIGGSDIRIEGRDVRLPERHIRRVVCRMMVYPAGFSPSADDGRNWVSRLVGFAVDGVGDMVKSLMDHISRWLTPVFTSAGNLAKKGAEYACKGVAAVNDLTSASADSGEVLSGAPGMGPGALALSSAGIAQNAAVRMCERFVTPAVPTCRPGTADVVLEGRCVDLPEMELSVDLSRSAYYAPRSNDDIIEWVEPDAAGGEVHRFYPVDPDEGLTPDTVGMAELRLDFDFAWDSVDTGLYNGVAGYSVMVRPDPRAYAELTGLGEPNPVRMEFLLPRQVLETSYTLDHDNNASNLGSIYHEVSGFWVGGLNRPRSGSSTALFTPHWRGNGVHTRFTPLSVAGVRGDFEHFNRIVAALPLSPGYTHTFAVAPYVGTPGSPDFEVAHQTREFAVSGSDAICMTVGSDDANHQVPAEDRAAVSEYLNCGQDYNANEQIGFNEDDYRVGLLGLASSDVCGDIFSATPPKFTWDNEVVRRVWTLMWVVAGSVLFILLVWQSFRMTFDLWLAPRPAVGFREMLPRFLAAVALAASSLFLCKWILILCNDLACFVAQMTGMTMWGVIGETFLTALDGFFGMFVQWDIRYIINPGEMFVRVTLAGILVLLLMIMMIWLFLKVLFGMLMRIALLALLIVFAPLAFAFYASEDTAHWTKTWVSMFFGTAFQQVAVLVVIYVGGNLIGTYAGSESDNLTGFLTGMILGLLVLVAADKIVHIVNPTWSRGSGIFSGFGAMVGMAATAAVMIATAGAGAIIGPAAAGAARGGTAAVGGSSGGGVASIGGSAGGSGGTAAAGAAPASPPPGGGSGGSTGATQNLPGGDAGSAGSSGGDGSEMSWGERRLRGAVRGLQWGANINNFANQLRHGRIDAHAFAPDRRRSRDQMDRFNQEIDRQISRGRQPGGGGGSNS